MKRDYPDRYSGVDLEALKQQQLGLVSLIDQPSLRNESRYFLEFAKPSVPRVDRGRVYSTLDAELQRIALQEVGSCLETLERQHPRLKGQLQAALIAVRPRSGNIVAMVGGRSYETSQFNRAAYARRQIGSVFKPFVYLAALQRAAAEGRKDLTPATVVVDRPMKFSFAGRSWSPSNYENEYAGPITWRKALALSRNVPAVQVATIAGLDRVVALWHEVTGETVEPYPSLALGALEATPLEIAQAYTLFANDGLVRPLRTVSHFVDGEREQLIPSLGGRQVARADMTFLVKDMMRGVLNEGTAVGARAAGFMRDAAGKTGTTNDLRDAWFVGFTPDLLTVVWVGRDDNESIGLSGAQAALPIWAGFMRRALADQEEPRFEAPPNVVFADIDPDTGLLASAACTRRVRQAFIRGTEPLRFCVAAR